jgi:hypothetical protein
MPVNGHGQPITDDRSLFTTTHPFVLAEMSHLPKWGAAYT